MKRRDTFKNGLVFPAAMVAKAAVEAGLSACVAFDSARRELALPRSLRRSVRAIHAEAFEAERLATSLAAAVRR